MSGTYPPVIATGACSVSRRSLGTTVLGGMLVSVVIGTILIPVFFVFIQLIVNKCCKRKNPWRERQHHKSRRNVK